MPAEIRRRAEQVAIWGIAALTVGFVLFTAGASGYLATSFACAPRSTFDSLWAEAFRPSAPGIAGAISDSKSDRVAGALLTITLPLILFGWFLKTVRSICADISAKVPGRPPLRDVAAALLIVVGYVVGAFSAASICYSQT